MGLDGSINYLKIPKVKEARRKWTTLFSVYYYFLNQIWQSFSIHLSHSWFFHKKTWLKMKWNGWGKGWWSSPIYLTKSHPPSSQLCYPLKATPLNMSLRRIIASCLTVSDACISLIRFSYYFDNMRIDCTLEWSSGHHSPGPLSTLL